MKKRNGFTLIELLVVIVLLGILATLGLASYNSSIYKSRDNRRKTDLRNIAVALDAYYNDNGVYPISSDTVNGGQLMACNVGGLANQICTWGKQFADPNGTVYMQILPGDPLGSQQYIYLSTNGKQYQMYTHLESPVDPDINATVQAENRNCGSGSTVITCNYGIASQNITP